MVSSGAWAGAVSATNTDDLLGPDKWGRGRRQWRCCRRGAGRSGFWPTDLVLCRRPQRSRHQLPPFFSPSFSTPEGCLDFHPQTPSRPITGKIQEWSVPVNFVVSKLVRIGNQPVSISRRAVLGGFAGRWLGQRVGERDLRFTLLFPKG